MEALEGLTETESKINLKKYGKNEIKRNVKVSPLKILLSQFTSPLVLILLGIAFLFILTSFIPGQESHFLDIFLILSIVIFSSLSGFLQEYKSEKTIEALQQMSVPLTKVIRSGKEIQIPVTELTIDDLVILEEGDVVPADLKIFESFGLSVDEAVLTGESKDVNKSSGHELYMNTHIKTGNAKAYVIRVGMQTKVGKIAEKLQEIKDEITPFQKEIKTFSKKISYSIIVVIFLITAVGMFKYDLFTSIFIAISLAVAAIPEGLPAIVVLTLAVAAKSMSKKNALIRRLAVTESIGSIDIICTDKTGTLTKNEMSVTNFYIDNISHGEDININSKSIQELIRCGILCNNSRIDKSQTISKKYFGDQTEIAIKIFSEKFKGFSGLLKNTQRLNEISFTSKRKMMSVVVEREDKKFLYSKGAPEVLINKCNRIILNGKVLKLTKLKKEKIIEQNSIYASDALRVLGFAYKEIKNNSQENNLIWIGLEAMIDPPKQNVKESISECIAAGIKVIMLTGDNPETAKAIAKKINLESTGVLTSVEIEKLTDQVLFQKIEDGLNIFARISPFDKLRILELLKSKYRVAMTGDGVNDALALKRADIGIAMGIRGTEVSKQASDMILLDDNFSTITEAIKEGRRVFNNIRKFINYLFTCNFAEVGVLLFASLFLNLDSPALLPIHILWINLLTDGLPALALGIDPARKDIMKIPPRKKTEGIINKNLFALIISIGTKKVIILSTIFIVLLPQGIDVARSALFTSFVIYEFVRIASLRQIEKLNFFSNKWLIAALLASLIFQLIAIYSPLSNLLRIVPLSLNVWGIILGFILIGYFLTFIITKLVVTYVKE